MTFGAPWALLGLGAIGLPVVIHLFSRRHARRQPFPTLRFLPASPMLPRRSMRLSDLPLLVVRCAIIGAAALALAQPHLSAGTDTQASDVARFVIVDSSASMRRTVTSGSTTALDSARRTATFLTAGGVSTTVVETAAPDILIPAAIDWLRGQEARRELILLSDFQLGAVDSATLRQIPTDIGVRLIAIPTRSVSDRSVVGGFGDSVQVQQTAGGTTATWTPSPGVGPCEFSVEAGANEKAQALDDLRAARTIHSCLGAAGSAAAIIYEDAEGRAALLAGARAVDTPWMAAVVQRLHGDRGLQASAALSRSAGESPIGDRFSVIATDSVGRTLAFASAGDSNGRHLLEVWSLADPGTLASVALIAALQRAIDRAPPTTELEQAVVPAATLREFERPASASGVSARPANDGRWLWLVVLLLLGVESVLRRRRRTADASQVIPESLEHAA